MNDRSRAQRTILWIAPSTSVESVTDIDQFAQEALQTSHVIFAKGISRERVGLYALILGVTTDMEALARVLAKHHYVMVDSEQRPRRVILKRYPIIRNGLVSYTRPIRPLRVINRLPRRQNNE